jgi:hypothetical protein
LWARGHTFAAEALAARISVFELSRLMGTSIAMIHCTYGHLVKAQTRMASGLAMMERTGIEPVTSGLQSLFLVNRLKSARRGKAPT